MTRYLLCLKCGGPEKLLRADAANGLSFRKKKITAYKPAVHQIITAGETTEVIDLQTLKCDYCNASISDGTLAYAVTFWNTFREREPGGWESDYERKPNGLI
jgi:hypothetical protein